MSRFELPIQPAPLPAPHLELAVQLEERGIKVWQQGDGLVADLCNAGGTSASSPAAEPIPITANALANLAGFEANRQDEAASIARQPAARATTHVFLCDAEANLVLEALPSAVVTAANSRRLMFGSDAGPVDLIPMGPRSIAETLLDFGLSAFAFAWRPVAGEWCDPAESLERLALSHLDVCSPAENANPFDLAPRRFWIAARLLSEHDLDPTPALIDSARSALPACQNRVPTGTAARRELERVLAADATTKGLRFLYDVGLSEALFPGIGATGSVVAGQLRSDQALGWAAWLAGASAHRAMRELRMPPRTARSIERLLRHHPIDRMASPAGAAGLRRIRQRLAPDEIAALVAWRHVELAAAEPSSEKDADQTRLSAFETDLDRMAAQHRNVEEIKRLAIGGDSVMEILASGPGRRVGKALAHLTAFIKKDPNANEIDQLETELRNWAALHPE